METYKDNYLMHYGVPGMKWGVRKQKRVAAKKEQRKKDYNEAKKKASSLRKEAKSYSKVIDHLKKNGVKEYDEYTDKEFKEITGFTKKQQVDHDIWSHTNTIDSLNRRAKTYDKIAAESKNTPLNKRTTMDISRRNTKVAKGAALVGTVLGLSGSIAIGKLTKSPMTAIGTAATTALLGGWAIDSIAPTSAIHIYDKRNKSK